MSAYETSLLIDAAHGIVMDVDAMPARLSVEIVAAKTMLEREGGRHALLAHDLRQDHHEAVIADPMHRGGEPDHADP